MNENKYLPIGTVCSIITSQKSVMIIGYKPVVFEKNEIKNYDYKAVYYPEGSLAVNSEVYFNHISITKILYNGYRDSSYINFNKVIGGGVEGKNTARTPEPEISPSAKKTSNYKFDENGFVIEEESVDNPFVINYAQESNEEPQNNNWNIFKEDGEMQQASSSTLNTNQNMAVVQNSQTQGPLEKKLTWYGFDENGNVIEDRSTAEPVAPAIVPGYEFDANGNVIDDGTTPVAPQSDVMGYQFDAAGNVIGDGSALEPIQVPQQAELTGYKFDANGNVIGDENSLEPLVSQQQDATGYKFDVNGNVVGDATSLEIDLTTPIVDGSTPNYKYDENGVVISE